MKRLKHWNFSPLFHKLKDDNTKKGGPQKIEDRLSRWLLICCRLGYYTL
jgi:hypothetical protein